MARYFRFPGFTRRRLSLGLAVLVLAFSAAYLLQQPPPVCCAPPPIPTPDVAALQTFRNTCMREARHANGGGDLVMDDATEAKIGAYCGCVADGVEAKVMPSELMRIADGTQSPDTTKAIDAIVADCRPKLK